MCNFSLTKSEPYDDVLINDSIEYGHIRGELSGENRLMSDVSAFNGAGTVA